MFFLPVTPDYVEAVLEKEKPDAILISMGGQTALNCGIELDDSGVLAKHNCRVLGTSIETVIATEDREIFKNKCLEIGEPCANSIATNTVDARGLRSRRSRVGHLPGRRRVTNARDESFSCFSPTVNREVDARLEGG